MNVLCMIWCLINVCEWYAKWSRHSI